MSGVTEAYGVGVNDQQRWVTWVKWLKKEFAWRRDLLPIKLVLFLYSGGTNAILIYLTLHMQQLGITVNEIAIIYAFLPIPSILGPPISGMIADRLGRYKLVVLLNLVLTAVLHVLLLYVPARVSTQISFKCDLEGHSITSNLPECDLCLQDDAAKANVTLILKECKYQCESESPTVEVCLHSTADSYCWPLNATDEMTISGTLLSHKEGKTCSHSWSEIVNEGQIFQSLTCPSACQVQCQATAAHECLHPSNSSVTFWVYFVMRIIATFFLNSLFTMMDALTLALVKQHGGEYGRQRFMFILGLATMPFLAGLMVDWHQTRVGYSDYMPAFYLGGIMCLVSAVFVSRLHVKVDMGSATLLEDLKKLGTRVDINIYMALILIMGSHWGFIESYLFVYLKELNAPNYLMGLTMTVGSLVGLPVMLVADMVVNKLGRHIIFIISFFAYAVRHFGYSSLTDPWMVFPFELLEVFTYQLMWVAAVTYCPILAPKGLLATMTGLAGAVHFSIGRGVGSFIGGYLITALGLSGAFKCYGVIAIVCGIIYILIHYCYFRRKLKAIEEEKKKEEREEEVEREDEEEKFREEDKDEEEGRAMLKTSTPPQRRKSSASLT